MWSITACRPFGYSFLLGTGRPYASIPPFHAASMLMYLYPYGWSFFRIASDWAMICAAEIQLPPSFE
jgi:hypothetical protein